MKPSYRCLILEDEPPAARVLLRYLQDYPEWTCMGVHHSPQTAMVVLEAEAPDLLFLDIHLPDISGLNVLRQLLHPPMVVFTTAYPQYAVEGFELAALDYLLKPISPERFQKAMERALERLEQERILEKTGQDSGFLSIRADRKVHRLSFQRILYLQALDDYVKIICTDGTLLPKITLSQLEKELPEQLFLRIHRSYIINLKFLQNYDQQEISIADRKLPIGKSFREQVSARLKNVDYV
ncbi:MAG: LytTR family DNA-binding domain-containing protein [Haliscomenobacter sp.]|uniref:LytR/AlgR family response regulator transcription factor n=1 Tax=Haliscomenobacter sp. TaxID=2717303 RepID=UPI0029B6572A|nr:LytTR family DNA-binding domain-containing protein [Haliscomenobacter sp.]MDX2072273.1 LytTR family DNA-binding domain-containing protein [Haliscomenobacter sp.]